MSLLLVYLFIYSHAKVFPFSLGNWLKMKISRSIYTFALTQGDASAMYDALTNLVSREEEFRTSLEGIRQKIFILLVYLSL